MKGPCQFCRQECSLETGAKAHDEVLKPYEDQVLKHLQEMLPYAKDITLDDKRLVCPECQPKLLQDWGFT